MLKSLNRYRSTVLKQLHFGSCNCLTNIIYRNISAELTAALRPFYFAVHPDLFGQYPKERTVNEDSLKQLSSVLQALHERKYHVVYEKKILKFYIRDATSSSRNTFKLIRIKLDSARDPKTVIQQLLELCNLPTDYVKSIKSPTVQPGPTPTPSPTSSASYTSKMGQDFQYGNFDFQSFQQARKESKKTLDVWIKANAAIAKERASELDDLKEEVKKVQKDVVRRLGLVDARYDCGWNYEHFRGCLKSLERLAELHENHMRLLRGRIIVFAPFTGISREGHVMLFTGDVLNSWIEFIKNIPVHDMILSKIPLYENTLSQVLRNIKIARRKFMPKQQVSQYANHLLKITTTLGDYLTYNKYPEDWPENLNEYEIVVESESGPLMVSPTGQLIAPATCPGTILVDFITKNLDIAKERKATYSCEKLIEKQLVEECQRKFHLKTLTKDDSITPKKMIESLDNLLKCSYSQEFSNIDLHIANYYSVSADGTVCIPWDFFHINKYN